MIKLYPVDNRNLSDHDHLILKVLRLYYERDLTQAQIAKRLGFSRPKVSKLLSEGRSRGLVNVEIAGPTGDFAPLEIAVEDRYGLPEVLVVTTSEEERSTDLAAGMAAGALLARLCTRASSLGVSGGKSLRALADALPPKAFMCGKVVPLAGGMGRLKPSLHSNQICTTLAEKLSAECLYLAAPAIARSPESRDELMSMPGIEEVLAEGSACDVAVVGIGSMISESTIVQAGYLTPQEFLKLREQGVVGDVCYHFLDGSGAPCLPHFSRKVVGLTLDQLRDIPKVVGIATGKQKAPGVEAVLRGGYLSALVCDRDLAQALLGEEQESQKEGEAS